MAGKRIEIMDLRQLIILKKQGLSNRKISDILHLSRNTVNEYVKLFEGLSLSYQDLLCLEERQLRELLPARTEVSTGRYEQLAGSFGYFSKELTKPGCTLLELWKRYRQQQPDGYGYTQFTQHYKNWSASAKGSGKLEHKAGERVFVDYSGKKLHVVDAETGELRGVEVFVAILPASQYTYLEASPSQRRGDFIASMRRCLEYFGGVPQAIVSDNLKSAVSKGCRYEPVVNKTFKDFALHYGCAIDPARPYSAKDKAMVEGAIKLIYQRIFYPLSKMTFFSLGQLNEAIRELLTAYNDYLFQHTHYSRKELFVSTEKALLQSLPPDAYQIKHYKRAKVQKMGHIFFSPDKHYYSVPHRYIGRQVELRYDQSSVEIFYHHERLCSHKRDYRAGKYSTISEHMCSAQRQYSEWNLEFFQRKCAHIGPHTVEYITRLILQYKYPEIGYKQALGIVHLERMYQKERVENACRMALDASHYNYRIIENMLKHRTDQPGLFDEAHGVIVSHKNIRGPENYR